MIFLPPWAEKARDLARRPLTKPELGNLRVHTSIALDFNLSLPPFTINNLGSKGQVRGFLIAESAGLGGEACWSLLGGGRCTPIHFENFLEKGMT